MNLIYPAGKMELSAYLCKKIMLLSSTATCFLNQRSIASYEQQLNSTTSYDEWLKIASVLDELDGSNQWKEEMESKDYDYELIQTRLNQMRELRKSNKGRSAMIFFLRTSLARNLGDMGNPKLYAHSRVGTKKLISEYIDEVVKQLEWICRDDGNEDTDAGDDLSNRSKNTGLNLNDKYEFFTNIRQSFGRTALLLSGGGTLGLNHLGVIKALLEAKLLPRIISGASSGSIMASLICTKTLDELPFDPSIVRMDVFERNGQPDTPLLRLQRLLMSGQLFDIQIFREAMRSNLGDITFQEAFYRTRFVLNITVSSSTLYDMPRLLNYLTAPDVLIWSAVAASCAVPIFYGSSPLFAKDKNGQIIPWDPTEQLYIDGSVENDLPMNRLAELFNVNHFIVCQVNPHVIPFLQKAPTPTKFRQAASFFMRLGRSEIQHRCTQLTELGVMPSVFNKIQSVLSQKYYGDITIIPEISYLDFLKVLTNPTPEYVMECIQRGERATWSKMSIIRNHLQIELLIDQMLYHLRLLRLERMKALSPPLNDPQRRRPVLEMRSNSLFSIPNQQHEEDEEASDVKNSRPSAAEEEGEEQKIANRATKLAQRSSSLQQLTVFEELGKEPCIDVGSQSTPLSITSSAKDPCEPLPSTTARERHHTKQSLFMTKQNE